MSETKQQAIEEIRRLQAGIEDMPQDREAPAAIDYAEQCIDVIMLKHDISYLEV